MSKRYNISGVDLKNYKIDYDNLIIIDSMDDNSETTWWDLLEDIRDIYEDIDSGTLCDIAKDIIFHIINTNTAEDIGTLVNNFLKN